MELLDYMIINDIEAGIMLPKANSFNMQTKKVDPRCLKNFIRMQFQNNEPEYHITFILYKKYFGFGSPSTEFGYPNSDAAAVLP